MESRHISAWIHRPAADVYRYAADPTHLPEWAAGLARGEVTNVGDQWIVQSATGTVTVTFTPINDLGVLDHVVTAPGREPVFNPLRVLAAGPEWSEVVFTLRRQPGMSDADYLRDADAVTADLATLKQLLET